MNLESDHVHNVSSCRGPGRHSGRRVSGTLINGVLHRLLLLALLIPGVALSLWGSTPPAEGSLTPVNVTTWHYDTARSGLNTHETFLTPALVHSNTFGLLFNLPTDDFLYAQPLYLTGVSIPGKGVHNVVYAVTENDSVYAYDADSNTGATAAPLWTVHLTDAAAGTSAVPLRDYNTTDGSLTQLGITGTPVIDPGTGTLYLVAHVKDSGGINPPYYHLLCALDVATGAQKFGGPIKISAQAPGMGINSIGGTVLFNDFYQLQRSALLLLNGVVYVAFSSMGDYGPYHGWLLGYDARTLQQVSVFNDTPNGVAGGIWMAGAGPAADADGSIYLMTGNGTFDGQSNFGDSFVKLGPASGSTPTGNGIQVQDYFSPSDQALLASVDGDLGSGGPILLPDEAGSASHPHLVIGVGKDGILYLVDRDDMGHNSPTGNDQIVQAVSTQIPSCVAPLYFNHQLYINLISSYLYSYSVTNARLSTVPVSQTVESLGAPGGSPCLSANGLTNAILWIIQASGFRSGSSAILRAYDANDITHELYDNTQAGVRDLTGLAMKFSTPMISNGKVYVGTGSGIGVFGVFPPPALSFSPPHQLSVRGMNGVACTVQYSSDLGAPGNGWQTLTSLTLNGSTQTLSDSGAGNAGQRFYRAVIGTP